MCAFRVWRAGLTFCAITRKLSLWLIATPFLVPAGQLQVLKPVTFIAATASLAL